MNTTKTETTDRFRVIMFGPIAGHGGRTSRYDLCRPTIEEARAEAGFFLSENTTGLVDLRVETTDQDGVIRESRYRGAFAWDDTRKGAVLRPRRR